MNRAGICRIVWIGIVAVVPVGALAADSSLDGRAVVKEAREAVEATQRHTVQQKEALQYRVSEELATIQKQLRTLQHKAAQASSETRADLQRSINELERKKDAAKSKLDELKSATGTQWDELEGGMNAMLEELKASYRRALSRLP